MTARRPLLLSAFLILGILPLAPTLTAGPAFYETCVLADTPSDFSSNGALDLRELCVSERHILNEDAGTGVDKLYFRLGLRNWQEHALLCTATGQTTTVRYIAGYSAGGQAATIFGDIELTGGVSPQAGPFCNPPVVKGPLFVDAMGAITLALALNGTGIGAGATLTDVWAASALVSGTNVAYQDTMPKDNRNAPSGAEAAPEGTLGQYTLVGLYPFLTAGSFRPESLTRFTVAAGETFFSVQFNVSAVSTPDNIELKYETPEDWKATGNLGNRFSIGNAANATVDADIIVTAPDLAQPGTSAVIIVHAYLVKSGGYVSFPVTVNVCTPKCEMPEYMFDLLTAGPFKEGETSRVAAHIAESGVALNGQPVAIELTSGSQRLGPFAAKFVGNGTYETTVVFPAAGAWDVDVFVDEPNPPFPTKRFQVRVDEKGGLAPGLDAVALIGLAVLGAAFLRRRD